MKISPVMLLFFLSAMIAELLLGSAPPIEFFNPLSFLLLSSLYGSGALIARELKIRWNKNYISLFFLGAAYAIIEEGLMVKSFFDPNWMDIGILGVYGRWFEINWVWALWLTIYHSIFSIAIPIAIVELIYPKRRNKSWLSNKKLAAFILLLIGVTTFGYQFLTSYRPPILQYLMFIALIAFLVIIAYKIPGKKQKTPKILSHRKAIVAGFAITAAFFLLFGAGPHLINPSIGLLLLGLAFVYAIYKFLRQYTWNKHTLYQKFSIISGALLFLIILTPLQELDSNRLDNTQGMTLIGIIALIMLLFLRRKLKRNPVDSAKELI